MKKKIIVRCPCLTVSGYSVHSMFVLRSLRKYEDLFDIYVIPINWGQCSWKWEDNEERQWLDSIINKTSQYLQSGNYQFDIACHITIANELDNNLHGQKTILVTAGIESDKISAQWVEKIQQFADKVIVPSEHAKMGFVNTSYTAQNNFTKEIIQDFRITKPVETIGYPAEQIKPLENYDQLQLDTNFNFLYQAQIGPRKAFDETILWFVEEFHNDEDVGLVCKVSLRNNCYMDRCACENKLQQVLSKYPNRKCKVYMVHGFMTDEEQSLLFTHPKIKAIVNIGHGEGFGLPLFNAVCSGMPVITCNHSGQKDFLHMLQKDGELKPLFAEVEYELNNIGKEAVWDGVLVPESKWAYARPNSFKMKMREVWREYPRFKQQAKRLQKYVLERFESEKQYKLMAESILGEKIQVISVNDLPKVSVFTSVFKGGEFIEGYMKDITRQSIFNNIELILVHPKDSPDFEKEQEIIRSYLDKYSNIVYHQVEKDPGLYASWNIGARLATGEYVGNRNLDDRLHPLQLEKCAKELYLNSNIQGVYFDHFITHVANETFEQNSSGGKRYNFSEFSFQNLKLMNLIHAAPMYKKELHDKFGYYDEKYRSASDWEFFLRVCQKGSQFKKMSEVLGLYMWNEKGVSTNKENFSWKRVEEKEVYKKYKDLSVEKENE